MYSGVIGGCNVANLSVFRDISESELGIIDYEKRDDLAPARSAFRTRDRPGGYFYTSQLLYWFRGLNGSKREMEVSC